MDKVAIIILNWNSTSNTLNCLKSLEQNHNLIILDNGSTTSELETLKKNLPDGTELILNDRNYGFARGNNQGIKYAIDRFQPEYIMLLNSDTIVTPDFLEPLISLMTADPKIAAVQPKILNLNNKSIIDSAGQIAYAYGSVRDIGIGKLDRPGFQERKAIFGTCCAAVLYRTSALKDTGLFDERLFSLFEDVDLSWRTRLKGYKILYEPASVVYHKRGVSGKIEKNNKVIRRFYGFRNCLLITIRYYPLYYIIKFLPVHLYRLITALYFKLRHMVKAPFFKLILNAFKERHSIRKSPLIKDIQKRWIV